MLYITIPKSSNLKKGTHTQILTKKVFKSHEFSQKSPFFSLLSPAFLFSSFKASSSSIFSIFRSITQHETDKIYTEQNTWTWAKNTNNMYNTKLKSYVNHISIYNIDFSFWSSLCGSLVYKAEPLNFACPLFAKLGSVFLKFIRADFSTTSQSFSYKLKEVELLNDTGLGKGIWCPA